MKKVQIHQSNHPFDPYRKYKADLYMFPLASFNLNGLMKLYLIYLEHDPLHASCTWIFVLFIFAEKISDAVILGQVKDILICW